MNTPDLTIAQQPQTAIKPIRQTLFFRKLQIIAAIILVVAILAILNINFKVAYFTTAFFGFIAIGLSAVYVIRSLTHLKKQRDQIVHHIASNNNGTVDVSDVFAMTTSLLENTYVAFLPNELVILHAKTNAAVHAKYSDVESVAHHNSKSEDEYVFYILGRAYAYRLVGTIDDIAERFDALDTSTKLAGANIVPALGARLVYSKVASTNLALDQRAQSALLGLLASHGVTVTNF